MCIDGKAAIYALINWVCSKLKSLKTTCGHGLVPQWGK